MIPPLPFPQSGPRMVPPRGDKILDLETLSNILVLIYHRFSIPLGREFFIKRARN